MDEKKVVNSLEEIEKIGISEIARVTHIEPEYIQYIAEKNYEKLKSKNVKCFIKVIEREYHLDLNDWMDEYDAYNEDILSKDSEPIFSNSIKQKEIVIKDNKKFPTYLIWLLILILLIFAVFKFELYDFEKYFPKNMSIKPVYQNNTTPMVKEVEDKLEDVGIIGDNSNQGLKIKASEENDTKLNALEMVANLEDNITQNLEDNDSMALDSKNSLPSEEENSKISEASITPNGNIWIGIIDVKSGKKTTLITDKEYKLNLEKEQLILTGHGVFTLKFGETEEKLNYKDPYRLHIVDGKVKKINYDEFIKLNKGKAW